MNPFEPLQSFAKGKATDHAKQSQRNGVIYTRVSTKEQADTNQSLETQKKYCLQYALKHDLNVLGFFGGTYESAKTDERNEFKRMIRFVKNQKEGVSAILVYSLDRFNRTGDNAIFISSERCISISAAGLVDRHPLETACFRSRTRVFRSSGSFAFPSRLPSRAQDRAF